MPRFFLQDLARGMPISTKGFAAGVRKIAVAVESLSVANGHVSWSADGKPKIVVNAPTSAAVAFEVVTEFGDYLMCARVASFDDSQHPVAVSVPDGSDEVLVKIWKPWVLRQTPFDGLTREGVTYATKPTGYVYSAGESNLRRATRTADSVVEWQVTTPGYMIRSESVSGELLYAISGGDGIFVDLNTAGRCWAVTDEPEVEET
jgi:hypothetical protein